MDKHLIHVSIDLTPQCSFPLACLMKTFQWGAGYNQCPGRNLAHLEISKITATLLRDYDIEQVDPKQEWTYESWFVALPSNWPCYVKRRNVAKVE